MKKAHLLTASLATLGCSLALAKEPTPSATAVAKAVNSHGADLLARQPAGENVFLSPASIAIALGMTSLGARGATLDAFDKVLHKPADLARESFHEALGAPDPEASEGFSLRSANRIYSRKGVPLRAELKQTVEKTYRATIEDADFGGDPEGSRKTINDWVAARTNDRIKDLLPKGTPTRDARLVLVNALYFKAKWESPFLTFNTNEGDFHVSAAKTAKAKLMFQRGHFAYAEDAKAQLLALPYKGGRYEAVFLLPKDATAPVALDAAQLDALRDGAKIENLDVTIPRFKVTWSRELSDDLKALGLAPAFAGDADFSAFGEGALRISQVIHKAFVSLDEEGTEAAAATAVAMVGGAAPKEPEHRFRADHPFIFGVRDTATGALTFLGRIVEPGVSSGE